MLAPVLGSAADTSWGFFYFRFFGVVLNLWITTPPKKFNPLRDKDRLYWTGTGFATPWTVAHQVPLSSTVSQRLLKFMSIESVMPPTISSSVAPFSFCFQSFPASGSFPVSQLFASGSQSTRDSALALVLPMSIQSWFPLGLTGLISLLSKGLSRVCLLQHHSSKASILQGSAFLMV